MFHEENEKTRIEKRQDISRYKGEVGVGVQGGRAATSLKTWNRDDQSLT
jgi:hypothetical protein